MDDEIRPKALMIPFDKFVILDILPPEQYKNTMTKMRDYVNHGKEPEGLEPIEQIAFESLRPFMDENIKNYRDMVENNRKNGSKGGRPRKPKETDRFSDTHFDEVSKPEETRENLNSKFKVQNSKYTPDTNVSGIAADVDTDLAQIVRHYEQAVGSFPRSALDKLQKWRQSYSTEMILLAIDKAAEAGKRSWSYINGILSGWQRDGLHTPGDVAAADARRATQKANAPRNKAMMASRPPEEAASAGNFLANAAHRRPLKKKGEQHATIQSDP